MIQQQRARRNYTTEYTLEDWLKCIANSAGLEYSWDANRNYLSVRMTHLVTIKKVIFNDPATIVFWADGTKTVVKAVNEEFDPEKGLAMAISKKAFGNRRDYYEIFLKWVGKYHKQQNKKLTTMAETPDDAKDTATIMWSEISKAADGNKILPDGTVAPVSEESV